ncbi:hypothetical protein IFM89_038282 [Coptis chinensis]|uniref:Uncharacterized protein n=1 Tax=Coptis chinensis TaxID=261450 RepID=A0A835M3H3_9MAGN|nr:hypothetical protein IFM89_038282 [Coptis chinensis]
MSMGRGLGSHVGVDKHTLQRDYGFFASVLVEVDLVKLIPNQILVEEDEHTSFLQEVEVEKLPKYCGHCKSVRNLVAECKALQKGFRREEAVVAEKQAEVVQKQKKKKRNRNKNKNVSIEPTNNVSVETMGTIPVEVPTTTPTGVVPIDVGTVDIVVEQQATEEDAQTQEGGIDHVDAIPQVGVAKHIVIDVVALLPLAVEMQSMQPLNAPQAEVTTTNCSLAVENFVSLTLCNTLHCTSTQNYYG